MSKEFKEVHVVNNTHWDREWRMNYQRTRMMLVKMIDHLLFLLENHPEYSSYTLDAHTIMIEDYLQIKPENKERIQNLIQNRRLFVGPWYTLPDMFNIGQESIIRNLLRGVNMANSLGHCMKIGYTPCSWGQTGQLPQIYAGFGIHDILFYRGFSLHEAPAEFLWEAPDGTRALTHRFSVFARYNYYYLVYRRVVFGKDLSQRSWNWGEHDESPMRICDSSDPTANVRLYNPHFDYNTNDVKPAFEDMLEREGDHYVGDYFLAMHGHDISFPHLFDALSAIDGNKAFDNLDIKVSNLEDYMNLLKQTLDLTNLKVLKGERRTSLKYGMWTYLFPGSISARVSLKQENFRTEKALVNMAEPFTSLAFALGATPEYPSIYLDLAWKYLLTNHTHDAHAGCGNDLITEDVKYRYRQTLELAEACLEEAFANLMMKVSPENTDRQDLLVMVYNPTQSVRSDVVKMMLETPAELQGNSLRITDEDGNEFDYQPITTTDSAVFTDNYWNIPELFDTRRFEIEFPCPTIPPYGYKVFRVEARKQINRYSGSLITATNTMENEFLQVVINSNGTFDILHKESGAWFRNLGYFMDSGEVGNAWQHRAPQQDITVNSLGCNAIISVVQDGRCTTTFKVEIELEVPAEVSRNGLTRSHHKRVIPIAQFITLKRGVPRVEIRTELDNSALDHWLRVVFPTCLNTDTSYADSHFDIVKRAIPLPDTDTWKEPTLGTKPMRTFVDLNDSKKGLSVMVRGLQEYEAIDEPERPIAVTLLRAFPIVLEVTEQKKQVLPDIGPQCLGKQIFEYALYPHSGDTFKARVIDQAEQFANPLRAVQFRPAADGTLPWTMGFLKHQPRYLVMSAIKKAERSNQIVVRMFNPLEKEVKESMEFGPNIMKAITLNLAEQEGDELKVTNNVLELNVPGKKIVTIGLTVKKEEG